MPLRKYFRLHSTATPENSRVRARKTNSGWKELVDGRKFPLSPLNYAGHTSNVLVAMTFIVNAFFFSRLSSFFLAALDFVFSPTRFYSPPENLREFPFSMAPFSAVCHSFPVVHTSRPENGQRKKKRNRRKNSRVVIFARLSEWLIAACPRVFLFYLFCRVLSFGFEIVKSARDVCSQ